MVVRLESKLSEMTKEKEVMARELEDCQQQVEVMKETVVKSKQEQDKLQSANSKVSLLFLVPIKIKLILRFKVIILFLGKIFLSLKIILNIFSTMYIVIDELS